VFWEGLLGLLVAIAFIPSLRGVRKNEDRERMAAQQKT
jgi:hypothetical protein